MLHSFTAVPQQTDLLSDQCWIRIAELPPNQNTVIELLTSLSEQHGPRLPFATEPVICSGVASRALGRLPAPVSAVAKVAIFHAKSEEHLHFAGTVTLAFTALLATMNAIGDSVCCARFRNLLIVNAHDGQPQVRKICTCKIHCLASIFQNLYKALSKLLVYRTYRGPHIMPVETRLIQQRLLQISAATTLL